MLTADGGAEEYAGGDGEIGGGLEGPGPVEVCDERGVGVVDEGTQGAGGAWDKSVGGGECGADEGLVAEGDVEDGAGAGSVEPSE